MTLPEQILQALKSGPMTPDEVGQAIRIDEFTAAAHLRTLHNEKLIVRELDGRYGLDSGGYVPPEAA